MTVNDIVEKLELEVVSGHSGLGKEITGGYVSDLLSDVMGHADEGDVWITLQTHKNVMAIASLKDLAAVIIVKGFKAEADCIEKSNEEDIPVLSTQESTFEVAGKLYSILQQIA